MCKTVKYISSIANYEQQLKYVLYIICNISQFALSISSQQLEVRDSLNARVQHDSVLFVSA